MPALEAETGCRVDWRPVHGPDIRRLRGRDPFAGAPVSGQYDWTYRRIDAERWADYYGIPYREPTNHQFDFHLLARAAVAGRKLGAAAACGWALTAAVYGAGAWPVDETLCVRLAEEIGLPRREFSQLLGGADVERLLADAAEEAHRRGAFGVPTFFVGSEMFWGNDRIAILRHVLAKRRA